MLKINELVASGESYKIKRNKRSAFYESAFLTIDKKEISSRWDSYNLTKYINAAESSEHADGATSDGAKSTGSTKKGNKFSDKVKSLIERSKKWIETMWEKIKKFFKNLWNRLVNIFKKKQKKDAKTKEAEPVANTVTNVDNIVKSDATEDSKKLGPEEEKLVDRFSNGLEAAKNAVSNLIPIMTTKPVNPEQGMKQLEITGKAIDEVSDTLDIMKTRSKNLRYMFTADKKWSVDVDKGIIEPLDPVVHGDQWKVNTEIIEKMVKFIESLKRLELSYAALLNAIMADALGS